MTSHLSEVIWPLLLSERSEGGAVDSPSEDGIFVFVCVYVLIAVFVFLNLLIAVFVFVFVIIAVFVSSFVLHYQT